jgi:LacI family transcriptional regulator
MAAGKPTIMFIAIRQGYFSREVLRGLLATRFGDASGNDVELWVAPPMEDRAQLEACLENRNVVGVISRGLSRDLLALIEKRDIPVVCIRGPEESGEFALHGLHVDDDTIGSLAGGEFVRLNLREWGFIHWEGVAWSEARKESLLAFAQSQGVAVNILSLPVDKRHGWSGVSDICSWLAGFAKPCGILACNDEAGVAVLHACKLSGLRVPEEVAVIGVDNDGLLCESSSPSLSSIDLHAAQIGRAAAHHLLQLLKGDDPGQLPHVAPAVMVVRESSHEVDRYLLIYQNAMNYIASHALRGPHVADVAAACGISKRGLERAFAKHAVGSPAEMIREQRAAGILRLLKNQSLGLANIAQQSGFSDASGLSNFIKNVTGKPPGAWRK